MVGDAGLEAMKFTYFTGKRFQSLGRAGTNPRSDVTKDSMHGTACLQTIRHCRDQKTG
jgi:hypothetical protein